MPEGCRRKKGATRQKMLMLDRRQVLRTPADESRYRQPKTCIRPNPPKCRAVHVLRGQMASVLRARQLVATEVLARAAVLQHGQRGEDITTYHGRTQRANLVYQRATEKKPHPLSDAGYPILHVGPPFADHNSQFAPCSARRELRQHRFEFHRNEAGDMEHP